MKRPLITSDDHYHILLFCITYTRIQANNTTHLSKYLCSHVLRNCMAKCIYGLSMSHVTEQSFHMFTMREMMISMIKPDVYDNNDTPTAIHMKKNS